MILIEREQMATPTRIIVNRQTLEVTRMIDIYLCLFASPPTLPPHSPPPPILPLLSLIEILAINREAAP